MTLFARITQILETRDHTAFGALDRTTGYTVGEVHVTGGDRHAAQRVTLSAGLSSVNLSLAPLNSDTPGRIVFLRTTQPVDLRLNSVSAPVLSGVYLVQLAAQISALYVDIGSQVTTLLLDAVGGSGASIQVIA